MTKKKRKPSHKRRARRTDRLVLLSLIFAFPMGLFLMWSDRCRWPRWMKTGVSTAIAAILVVMLAPFTQPPAAPKSGVRIVSTVSAMENERIGPEPGADFQNLDIYIPYEAMDYNIIAAPTEAPEVIFVYCNDMGKYYHSENCRYTKRTTPKVPLIQAVNAGFKRCPDCDAPAEPKT